MCVEIDRDYANNIYWEKPLHTMSAHPAMALSPFHVPFLTSLELKFKIRQINLFKAKLRETEQRE